MREQEHAWEPLSPAMTMTIEGAADETGRITAMVGVPALWSLLHRKITQEFAAKPALVEQAIHGLMSAHAELRNRRNINLGKLLFWPIHNRFGGRLRQQMAFDESLPARKSRQERKSSAGFDA